MDMNELIQIMEVLGVPDKSAKLNQFKAYREQILEWNKKINLTTIVDPKEFERRHFVESLQAAGHPAFPGAKRVLDLGTGAGFPGIPLAICYPEKEFVLVDSLAKRLKVIKDITGNLRIENIDLRHGRAEDLAHQTELREQFDLGLSRAVARMAVLAELGLAFIKVGGYFGAYKSKSAEAERAEAEKAVRVMGAVEDQIQVIISSKEGESMPIYWYVKQQKTPGLYPRQAGIPSQKPLI